MDVAPLTGQQTADLQAWRALALETMPYFASVLFSLRPVSAPGLGTFAVDPGHRLYIDFDAAAAKGTRWCAEALLHECGHIFQQHATLAEDCNVADHERMLANVAGDAAINDDLADAGCNMSDAVTPAGIGEPDYQTFHHYLDALRAKQQPWPPNGPGRGQSNRPGEDGDGQPYAGCGSASGGEAAPCELGDDDLNGQAEPATDAETERTLTATAASVRQTAKTRGDVPAGLVEQAELLLAPAKVSWRKVLAAAIKRAMGSRLGNVDVTYSRRHRRRHAGPVIYPGNIAPHPTIAVVRDTSGSMGDDELADASAEIEGIARQIGVRGRDLTLLDVDAGVARTTDYRGRETLTTVGGGGGTDMRVGIDAALDSRRGSPAAVVVVTDGFTPWPASRPRVPVVACLVGDGAAGAAEDTPDWLTTVVVE